MRSGEVGDFLTLLDSREGLWRNHRCGYPVDEHSGSEIEDDIVTS